MGTEQHITAWCTINNNKVVKNGEQLFAANGVNMGEFIVAAYKHLQVPYPKFYKMDNLAKLGWLAAEVLLGDSFEKDKYNAEQVAVILTNANASLDTDIRYLETVKDMASPALFVYTLPNIVVGEICIRNGFKGENAFYITQQFDAELIHRQVTATMDHGAAACICGWVDVLGDNYTAALFLVENNSNKQSVVFTANNLSKIFEYN